MDGGREEGRKRKQQERVFPLIAYMYNDIATISIPNGDPCPPPPPAPRRHVVQSVYVGRLGLAVTVACSISLSL